jgi:hypothetical protein
MQAHHIARRKSWLKYSEKTYDRLPDTERAYIEAAIEDYAKICLAERRDQDFEFPEAPKWMERVLWGVLAFLGGLSFTVLPSIVLEKTDAANADEWFIVLVSIIGIFLAFLVHTTVSHFLKEFDLNQRHLSTLKGLDLEYEKLGDKCLQKLFIEEQKKFLNKQEESLKHYPSLFLKIAVVMVSIFEVGGIWHLMYRDGENPDLIIVLIVSLLPLILLWILGWVTSSKFLVPKACKELKRKYAYAMAEINHQF